MTSEEILKEMEELEELGVKWNSKREDYQPMILEVSFPEDSSMEEEQIENLMTGDWQRLQERLNQTPVPDWARGMKINYCPIFTKEE